MEDVKAAVRKRGESLSSLSQRNGFCSSYLRVALIRPSVRAEEIIAKFIGVKAETIWPERYRNRARRAGRRA